MALAKDLFSLSLGLLILNGEKDVYLSLIWNLFYSIKKHKRVKAASFIWNHYHFSGDEVKVLVTHSCLTLRKPMDSSTLGFSVHHQHPEPAQTHVHWVGDAIKPSHPLSFPSPPAFKSFPPSGSFLVGRLFASGGQSIGASASAWVLPVNIQDWFPLGLTGWMSLQSKELSRVFSNTTVQKHQFFGAQLSSQSNSHIHTWPQEKP